MGLSECRKAATGAPSIVAHAAAMTVPQVLQLPPQQQKQHQQQLQQQLRRDLNRLSDSNRATRLQGARAILSLYTAEAARRAAGTTELASSNDSCSTASASANRSACAFSAAFLSSVYTPISALCADEASESCRATALELLQLVVKTFLSREEVIALCSGSRSSSIRHSGRPGFDLSSDAICCHCCDSRPQRGELSNSSTSINSEAAKPLVAVLAERLRDGPGVSETSEELRFLQLQLLQHLLLHYAADAPRPDNGGWHIHSQHQGQQHHQQGWSATALADCLLAGVSGALRDKNPSNAIEACRLLSAMSLKLHATVLLQVRPRTTNCGSFIAP